MFRYIDENEQRDKIAKKTGMIKESNNSDNPESIEIPESDVELNYEWFFECNLCNPGCKGHIKK